MSHSKPFRGRSAEGVLPAQAGEAAEDFGDRFHVAIVTTGMESKGCPMCNQVVMGSCMNETGENGRFQDRLGRNEGTDDLPAFLYRTDETCRVIQEFNAFTCFYNEDGEEGTVLLGTNGCGFERGLAPLRVALDDLADTYNQGFLRDDATLAVVVVSDLIACDGPEDVCVEGECVRTWTYQPPAEPPDLYTPHGRVIFADHIDPCRNHPVGETVRVAIIEN